MNNTELISRDALNEMVDDLCSGFGRETEVEGAVLIDRVATLPAVDAEVVRHGAWKPVMLKNVFGQEFLYRHACSICHEYALCECANYDAEEELSNYCPDCGAKMDTEVEG